MHDNALHGVAFLKALTPAQTWRYIAQHAHNYKTLISLHLRALMNGSLRARYGMTTAVSQRQGLRIQLSRGSLAKSIHDRARADLSIGERPASPRRLASAKPEPAKDERQTRARIHQAENDQPERAGR